MSQVDWRKAFELRTTYPQLLELSKARMVFPDLLIGIDVLKLPWYGSEEGYNVGNNLTFGNEKFRQRFGSICDIITLSPSTHILVCDGTRSDKEPIFKTPDDHLFGWTIQEVYNTLENAVKRGELQKHRTIMTCCGAGRVSLKTVDNIYLGGWGVVYVSAKVSRTTYYQSWNKIRYVKRSDGMVVKEETNSYCHSVELLRGSEESLSDDVYCFVELLKEDQMKVEILDHLINDSVVRVKFPERFIPEETLVLTTNPDYEKVLGCK